MDEKKKPLPIPTIDEIYAELGFCRLKGEDDEMFKRRVANRVDREKWVEIARKAQKRLEQILTGDGPDAEASEMAAIRTALEYAEGEPTKKIELSGPDGNPITFTMVPVTQEQIDRFIKRHAKSDTTTGAGS
jgi:hypothetical protein